MSIPLISYDGKHFSLTKQAKLFFQQIKDIQQLAVLSMIGKSKTGKSFFLNDVLLQDPSFEVSHTTNPCTKGIWISKKLIDSPRGDGMKIIVMDVEGLGGIEDNSMNDNRIILLPLILSSYLMYNSQGYITEQAIRGIGVVVGLAKELQREDEFSFPFFHWIIRDFTLELLDSSGLPLTQRQYLQKSLEEQKGSAESVEVKNKIRRKFKQYFVERDCNTLLRPYNETITELRPQFVHQSLNIRSRILEQIKCKEIKGIKMNPLLFLQFIENILIDINNGSLPNIENTWKMVYLEHEKDLLSRLEYKLFDNIESLKDEQIPYAYLTIKSLFEEMFSKQSLSSEDPSIEVIEEKERIIQNIKKQIDDKIKVYQEKKLENQVEILMDEVKLNTFEGVKQIGEIDHEVEKLFYRYQGERFDGKKRREIQSRIRLAIFEKISGRLEVQNKVLREENDFLKSRTEEDSKENRKLEEELKQFQLLVGHLKKELEHSLREKQIVIRNLETQLQTKKMKYQELSEETCKLNKKLHLVENSEEYSRTLYRLEQLERALQSIEKQYNSLTDEQSQLKGQHFILQQEKYDLQTIIQKLKQEAYKREQQITRTELRIVEQVEKEEKRIEAFIEDTRLKEQQKDQRIEKLERIIKELKGKPQRVEEICKINKLQEELDDQRVRNRKLEKQIDELKQIYEHKVSNLMSKKPLQNRSAIMNLELTPKGFQMKSFKSPPKLKEWQKERVVLETQISLQEQLNKQSKTLISSLLSKQQGYINQINLLKERISESYNESDFSSIKSAKMDRNGSLLDCISNISVNVPSFTIKTLENGHSITEYKLQFSKGSEVQWQTAIRYKQLVQLIEGLSARHPEIAQFKLPKTNKAEDKRRVIEKVIKQCLLVHQFRTDEDFKSFIYGSKMDRLIECRSQEIIPRANSPKNKLLKIGSKENIKLRSHKNPHFSIYMDS